jgi:catechol 2,3-dioxygenase-like lactoylglutathione lyase family enzyme
MITQSDPLISRRSFVRTTALAVGAGLFSTTGRAAAPIPSLLKGRELNHISLNVTDVRRAMKYYADILGMVSVAHGGGRTPGTGGRGGAFMHFEKGFVNLRLSTEPSINHFCISVDDFDADRVHSLLEFAGYKPWTQQSGRLLHVLDPDGNNVQIQEMGHGYGRGPGATAEIDKLAGLANPIRLHNVAIYVADLVRSKAFYQETFGLTLIREKSNDRRLRFALGSGYLELLKGKKPGLDRYGLAIRNRDMEMVRSGLKTAGFKTGAIDQSGIMSFQDLEGFATELSRANRLSN